MVARDTGGIGYNMLMTEFLHTQSGPHNDINESDYGSCHMLLLETAHILTVSALVSRWLK